MIKKVLITGATGFIGAHLAKKLLAAGNEVHIIIRPDSKTVLLDDIYDKLSVHIHDGSAEGMINIVHDASPEIVFHLASLFIANHREEDINALIYSNLLFGTQLSEAMVKTGALCLVNTGTSWQHFENEKYNPVNLYAATKQAFEDILKYYIESKKLKVVSLHLFDTFGDDDPRAKLMKLLKKTMETQIPLDMSPGEQKIDLVHEFK